MKITDARIDGFLSQPDPKVVAVLVYGPDRGLIRERAETLVRGVVEDLGDPFRIAELSGSDLSNDAARLGDEAAALSMTGGRRVVRVRDAVDSLSDVFRDFLAAPGGDALVVAEAGNLAKRSSLRGLFERADNAASIACYGDDSKRLNAVIFETLGRHGLKATPDALSRLAEILGADRIVTRNELEKLALYMGRPGTVELEDVRACVDDSAATSLDAVAYAAAGGERASLDRALTRAFSEGLHPVGVLRAAARHLQRLHLAGGLTAHGHTPDQAMKALRPPVIYIHTDRFRAQLRNWPPHRLGQALELVIEAELDCKTTGLPAEAVCSRALLRIAQAARRG